MKKAKSSGELSGDELPEADVVYQEDESDMFIGVHRLCSERYWSRDNPDLRFKIHSVALGAQWHILVRADKIIARSLIHKGDCQQILWRLGAASFAH